MIPDPQPPMILDAMTLRGIGSYLHGARLGRVDGGSPGEAVAVHPRLDGILRLVRVLHHLADAGRMASPPCAVVLLEDVVARFPRGRAKPYSPTAEVGNGQAVSHSRRAQPQRLLATLPHAQHSHRDDECLACRVRRHLAEGTLGQHSLSGRQSI